MSDFAGLSVPQLKNLFYRCEYTRRAGKLQAFFSQCTILVALYKLPHSAARSLSLLHIGIIGSIINIVVAIGADEIHSTFIVEPFSFACSCHLAACTAFISAAACDIAQFAT